MLEEKKGPIGQVSALNQMEDFAKGKLASMPVPVSEPKYASLNVVSVRDHVKEFVAPYTDMGLPEEVYLSEGFAFNGMDSLDLIELVINLEEKYDTPIPDNVWENEKTIEGFINKIDDFLNKK